MIDVSVPLRVSTVALKGYGKAQLLAPNCFVTNHGALPIEASIVSYEEKNTSNPLKFVEKNSGFSSTELNLRLKKIGETTGQVPVVKLSETNAFVIGELGKKDSQTAQLGYTFDALYDHANIIETNAWSNCYLSYKFIPVTNANP